MCWLTLFLLVLSAGSGISDGVSPTEGKLLTVSLSPGEREINVGSRTLFAVRARADNVELIGEVKPEVQRLFTFDIRVDLPYKIEPSTFNLSNLLNPDGFEAVIDFHQTELLSANKTVTIELSRGGDIVSVGQFNVDATDSMTVTLYDRRGMSGNANTSFLNLGVGVGREKKYIGTCCHVHRSELSGSTYHIVGNFASCKISWLLWIDQPPIASCPCAFCSCIQNWSHPSGF